jgi:isoquinoline 1-oxidoreductase alpha subunit
VSENHTFILNGKRVSVECDGQVRVLWVLRDLLGVHGPKYGCGLNVCKACTSHINGKAFHPCSVSISKIKATDEIVTIEGLAASVGKDLHPMQQAWLDYDVAQCGYCQPGQIMTAVSLRHLLPDSRGHQGSRRYAGLPRGHGKTDRRDARPRQAWDDPRAGTPRLHPQLESPQAL